jgi:hypothetical protein
MGRENQRRVARVITKARAVVSLVALVALPPLVASCRKPPPPSDTKMVAPWSVQVVMAQSPVGGDAAVLRCSSDGQDCAPAHPKDPIPPGSIFRVAPGGVATLSLDGTVVATLAPSTEVSLLEGPDHVVSLKHGAFLLSLESAGPTPGDMTLPTIRFPGGTISLPVARPTALSVAVQSAGSALVTVHHGKVSMAAGASSPVLVTTGETVRITPEGTLDRRAGFRGEIALAEVAAPEVSDADLARGLGAMTARVPGTERVVGGVHLASHRVQAYIRDGFARTEVEEVFQNDTDQVLEGRYVFPLPGDASISRLGLWVNGKLVEGEMVEAKRAAMIFKSIVDDTVRPRDPALLEWVKGSEFSLKVFPLPARGSRRMVLAYNQVLPVAGGSVRYMYPLSLGKDRSSRIDDLSIEVRVVGSVLVPHDPVTPSYAPALRTEGNDLVLSYHAEKAAPDADFVLAYRQDGPEERPVAAAYLPDLGELSGDGVPKAPETRADDGRFVALRLRADLPDGAAVGAPAARDRAIVLDVSQSQSADTVLAEGNLVRAILADMDAEENLVLLACDSACSSFPPSGLMKVGEQSFLEVVAWLKKLAPGGASDVAGALIQAAQRLASSKNRQILYLGDGAATSGELKPESIAARLTPVLAPLDVDLRLFGIGRTVDEVTLSALAETLGSTYERVATGEPLRQRAQTIALSLRAPVLVAPRVEATNGSLRDVFPKNLPNLRIGQEIVVLGKAAAADAVPVTLFGRLNGQPYALARTFALPTAAGGQNPLVPRLWAEQQIRFLEASTDKAAPRAVLDLSRRFHVMSRYSSLLVLENDRMFAEFGIERTTHHAADQSDGQFVGPGAGMGIGAIRGVLGALGSSGPSSDTGGGRGAYDAPAAEMNSPSSSRGVSASPAAPALPAAAAPPSPPPSPSKAVSRPVDMDDLGRGGGHRYMPPPPPMPTATITRADDTWTAQGQAALDKLREDVAKAPSSRRKLEAFVRGLLGKARAAEALPAARGFVELDPDLPAALELLSFAAVLSDDGPLALATVDAMCETNPQSSRAHLRAARAFEAAGSEIRACGHWRALAELDPASDGYRYESLRCLSRALSQPAPTLATLRTMPTRSRRLETLMKSLEAGTLPTHTPETDPPGAVEVIVSCDGGPNECPLPVVITPLGTIYSPWTPGDAKTSLRSVAFSRVTSGTYRIALVGGAPSAHGQVDVRALSARQTYPFVKGGWQSVAAAHVRL